MSAIEAKAYIGKEKPMRSGYEQIYESLIPKLGECDFSEASGRLGLSLAPDGAMTVIFLGREYEISPCGINPTDGMPVNVINRIVLAYYALSKGAGEPVFSYVPVYNFIGTGMAFGSNLKWMTDPLGKAFSGDYDKFRETLSRLGGVFEGKLSAGGYSWHLRILPKIPLRIVYYDGDEEFPCEIRILFDENASRFMEFECLAFLEGCLVRAMSMTAKTGSIAGWEQDG
ncbi:MAG: DUF3786 domain-containing protein [Clostridiales bacterium]|jgi:hypothetical protein|nr:DUF3786 domain-containing protein [Eubacteriales bacterium]MDH7567921.1 DUF3786 domain-containing protein [Clostridiales bacterium]